MHDVEIASVFQNSFKDVDEAMARAFVEASWSDGGNLHLAICDDDEYMGTVSLKDIDPVNLCAEYAISTRRKAHGTGLAKSATKDVLRYGFQEIGLHRVYLNVKSSNKRAISFYEKIGFRYEGSSRDAVKLSDGAYEDLLWFSLIECDEVEW